ncbi:ATP-binding response regulator [Leptospira kmetyi]|uniref:histidine kinase n=1 Tax=Leptospira kmetyi TaxID=408139 RepID=A0A2M9XUY5_9LEPT|nr:response regulator [Leptospira kmetyi]AYV57182.1 response regulator [Leptospira kmetyi]EQA52042.1 PAS domain S-box protein [Leptospira kmetyi serovar Malaysia str. Bejo-Iso9]PJZ28704.1 hybrid sensor histidine kinase/response regulator [Leptospira kmetyi]PJZ43152.1 hybrid sensor histidine kinase/response regulator [Leptospira kmetyi]TGK21456.1 response regulator [Leptospira kmetyi]
MNPSENNSSPSILIVDDEWLIAFNLQVSLQKLGYRISGTARTADEALEVAERTKPDLILMDIRIEGELDGIQAAERIQKKMDVPVIFMTAFADEETFNRAVDKASMFGYISKPFQPQALKNSIEIALKQQQRFGKAREEGKEFRDVIQNIGEGAISLDREGKILFMNRTAEALTGWALSDVQGENGERVLSLSTDDGENIRTGIGKPDQLKYIPSLLTRKNGSRIQVAFRVSPIRDEDGTIAGSIITLSELSSLSVSEKEISEMEKVIQSERRLDSIQKLAAGLAHEINNPLMGIINYGHIIRNHKGGDSDTKNYARLVIEQGERIAAIIRNLVLFSRKDPEQPVQTNVKQLVGSVEDMISEMLKSQEIQLEKNIPDDLEVSIRPNQIREVLYNILYYYSENQKKARIHLKAALDAGENSILKVLVSGKLGVELNLNEESRFEPFENFRSNDARIGMGLSVCYGILQANRGQLLLKKSNSGWDFIIQIPV